MRRTVILTLLPVALALPARAEKFELLTGVDARRYPGAMRMLAPQPGPGIPGPVYDGDRLAGTPDVGPTVAYVGTGTPLYDPNEHGSFSFLFRRGSVPIGPPGVYPLLGIEFLGGPLLDLDGDLSNHSRSLTPVVGRTPVEIPNSRSYIELVPNFAAQTITLVNIDATGCNEGGPGIGPDIATIVVTRAGTQPDGTLGPPTNPSVDTRVGMLTAFTGAGSLLGVYRVAGLGFEFWEDTIEANSATAGVLGTMQFLGSLHGWLVIRDPLTGQFPTLAGQGLGSTPWPAVNTSAINQVYNTAHGLFGGTATIRSGMPRDNFTAPGNGGVALTAFGGDLGAYFDAVVVPHLPADATRFVYLDAVGWGINNSNDPVFGDTVGYDVVLIGAARCRPPQIGDANCDGAVNFDDIDPFVAALTGPAAWAAALGGAPCDYLCANDVNADGAVNFDDIDPFVAVLSGQ